MRPEYDAIVIGTGFGGAIAACRLAQAGLKVGVLERGRRYDDDPFPRNWNNPTDGWLWSFGQGLIDAKPFHRMMVVQAAGFGGGSLIYANVHLRPPAAVFERGWPRGYSRAALDPYYDLVAYMLDIKPVTESKTLGVPIRAQMMKAVAGRLQRSEQFCYPNLAVDFGKPHERHPNKFGAMQEGCNYCTECCIGCNYHAKNTLDFNYLKIAEDSGADVGTLCEVEKIQSSGAGYKVTFTNHAADGASEEVSAHFVFLCAGAVNSTELLLRCRDVHGTLPKLSARLGEHYSGNGDFLGFAFNTREPIRPSEGPTITSGIVYSRADGGVDNWFILEDGGYPKEIGGLLQVLNPRNSFLKDAEILTQRELIDRLRGEAAQRAGTLDPRADSALAFLAMGRDLANGRISLAPLTHDLKIDWDVPSNLPLYDAETRLITDVAREMGGDSAFNPIWRMLRLPVSVHNLGGCLMADSADRGVTDPNGETYGYPGLFVLDGGALPSATGVNPSHTIGAVAERNIEAFIRRNTGNPNWRPPEAANAVPVIDPVSQLTIPASGVTPTKTRTIGIRFTETMRGFLARGWTPADDYVGAERAGQAAGTQMQFTLTITLPDLDAFLVSAEHAGIAVGTVTADGITSAEGAPVANGVFNLFVQGEQAYQRRMLYALQFTGIDGKPYLLDGFKDVRDHGHFDVWGASSTLYTVIREGHERSGPIIATGIIHILIPDFMHQLASFEVIGTDSILQKAAALERFGRMFFGTLWEVFVRPHL